MIQRWVDYRLHLNALFSTATVTEQNELLQLLQEAEARWLEQRAKVEEPTPSAPESVSGVSWDATKGKWRVTLPVDGRKRAYGRFVTRQEAEVQAKGVRAYAKAHGEMPEVGWRAG